MLQLRVFCCECRIYALFCRECRDYALFGVDGDGDLDVDNLHGRHMLQHQPLLHIFPGEAAVMPHSLEYVIHLPTHLCDKCCRCKVTFKNHKTCSDCGNRIKSKSESEKTHEMQIRTAYALA